MFQNMRIKKIKEFWLEFRLSVIFKLESFGIFKIKSSEKFELEC